MRLLLARDFAPLATASAAALDTHLGRCADCAALAAVESRLTAELLALRSDVQPSIDVRERVAAAVLALSADECSVLKTRSLGWAAAAGWAAALGFAWGLWEIAPGLTALAREIVPVSVGLRTLLSAATAAALLLGSALAQPLANLLAALAPVLRSLQPLGSTALLAGFALMISLIAAVLVRDFLKPHRAGEESR